MTHSNMRHDSFIYDTWLIHMSTTRDTSTSRATCPITCYPDSYMRQDSFLWYWLTHMWDMTHSYVRHDSLPVRRRDYGGRCCCAALAPRHASSLALPPRIAPVCPDVRHDSLTCETWLIDMWDMTHWHVRHDSLICETWLIDMWDMTYWHAKHDAIMH